MEFISGLLIVIGFIQMLCGCVTIYKNEGAMFRDGCFVASAGVLVLVFQACVP